MKVVSVAGLDLAGSPRNPSGLAILSLYREVLALRLVYSDEEIFKALVEYKPLVIAIDAPLSIPNKSLRSIDRKMISLGYRVLPSGWRSMRMLSERAVRLKDLFERKLNAIVIETHPLSALKSSGCSSIDELIQGLKLTYSGEQASMQVHEVDALISSLVALKYFEGSSLRISEVDGTVYLLGKVCE
ncbi:MAG: DUF429 domain-containing protein [Sulfolobales archaeon]|nr:DUF429 domain-containing protein [Sulfolobales archaeon]MCX8199222.1 DUF429 domain-containing protein [Sulfolobales archaeon]MDW8170202.1 DUF429 domain-containing protein [Desulfurococcaceae archaeon]